MPSKDVLQGLPGLREFYPDNWAEIDFILSKMREVSLRYNYQEYEGPSLEPIELYEAKSGDQLLGEVYHVYDRDNRHLVLRPEQTPTLSKMLAKEQQRFSRPMRWFSIPRLFRDEGVQRGRTKEFWQLNVDMLGEKSVGADAEVIAVAVDIVRACGARDDQFKVLVNHRGLLNKLLSSLGIGEVAPVIQAIDRKMKFVQEEIISELVASGMSTANAKNESMKIRKLLNASGSYLSQLEKELPSDYLQYLDRLPELEEKVMLRHFSELGIEEEIGRCVLQITSVHGKGAEFFSRLSELDVPDSCSAEIEELRLLLEYLEGYGVAEPVVFDLSLARGLDYYTGIVFEGFDASGDVVRALFGGGRYDDLVQVLGGQELSGVGFGMGDVALLEFIQKNSDSFTPEDYSVDIYVAPIKIPQAKFALELTQKLRKKYKVMCNPFKWKMKKHLNAADQYRAKVAIIIGPRDLENKTCNLRQMADGSSEDVALSALDEKLESILS